MQVIPAFGGLLLAFVVPGISSHLREGIPSRKGGQRAGRGSTALSAAGRGGVEMWPSERSLLLWALGCPDGRLPWLCVPGLWGRAGGLCSPSPAESCPPPPPTGSRRAGQCTHSRLRSRGRCRL